MRPVLKLDRSKWGSLSLSILLCALIALIAASAWYNVPDKIYSIKSLAMIASGWFLLLIGGVWFIIDHFLSWLQSKEIHISWRDPILLFFALILVIAAISSVWTTYGGKGVPNKFLSKFTVDIGLSEGDRAAGNICILEIKSQDGIKIQPENDPAAGFLLTGGWVSKRAGCQYFLQRGSQGNLKFQHVGRPGEVFQILFRENRDSGKTAVRINGEQVVEVDLYNGLEGNKLISTPIQFSRKEILLWNIIGTAGWTAILAMLAMIFILCIKSIHPPARIVSLYPLAKKHLWISLVPLVFVAVVMFYPRGVSISPDVGYYLSLAKNLYHGNGYVNPDLSPNIYRGPVFPLLISLSYVFLGESFRSAIIMERIFWFLTVFITYFLGRQLYNHRVGLLAASFVLTATVINQGYIRIWTDGPLTFAILALQLMFWQAFIKQRNGKWYALMGAVMGITYLLKQTVIFIAPLPLLTWIVFSEYRTPQVFKKLLIFYFVFALFYFGWDGYVYLAGGSSGQITGTLQTGINFLSYISRGSALAETGQNSPVHGGTPSPILRFLEILNTFYIRDVLRFFKIAVLFPVAIAFVVYEAVVARAKPDIFLALGIFLYSPLILVQAVVNFGFRQNLYFYCLVLLCIAAMLDRMFRKLSHQGLSNVVIPTVAFSLISIQLSGGNYDFPKTVSIKNLKALPYLSSYQEIADWVDKHVGLDMKIMIPTRESNYLHILTDGNRQFEIINTCMGETNFAPAIKCLPPYISFWVYKGTTDPNEPRDFLQGISETVLLSTIHEKNVKYIFVTPSIYSLYFYLKAHPDFKEVNIIDNIAIFSVIRTVHPIASYQNVEWELCIGRGTPEYLKNLKETDPTRFELKLKKQIEPWMGLTRQDLDAFMSWQGCQFDVNFPGSYSVD